MSDIDAELKSHGLEDCLCDYADSCDQPCVVCEERVKTTDHVHFKGQLFHLYCLLLAVLRNGRQG
jgi:hypothetical protein